MYFTINLIILIKKNIITNVYTHDQLNASEHNFASRKFNCYLYIFSIRNFLLLVDASCNARIMVRYPQILNATGATSRNMFVAPSTGLFSILHMCACARECVCSCMCTCAPCFGLHNRNNCERSRTSICIYIYVNPKKYTTCIK